MPTPTLLEGAGATTNTVHNTGSIAPAAGSIVVMWTFSITGGSTPTVSVAGLGLTWAEARTAVASGGTKATCWWAYAGASDPTPGAVTITHNITAITGWSIYEVTDANISTPIVQSCTAGVASGTSGTGTFGSAYATDSLVMFGLGHNNGNATTSEWSELDDFAFATSKRLAVMSQPGSSVDLTATMGWTGTVNYAGIGIEIASGNISLTESLAITEAVGSIATLLTGVSESLAITEATVGLVVAVAPVSEVLAITESLLASQPFVEPVSESLTISEAIAAGAGTGAGVVESLAITEQLDVEGGVIYYYPYDTQAAGGGSNAGYIASGATSSYESFAAQLDPTPLQGLEEAWEGVSDLVEDAWERPDALGDAPPLEELGLDEPEHQEPLAGPPPARRRAIKFMKQKRGLSALGDLLPNPTSGAIGSGASTVAGYAAAKAGKMLLDKIDPQKPWLKKHGAVAAAAAATGVALAAATKIKFLREHRGEIALGGLLACLELASAAYGTAAEEQAIEIPDEHQTGIALVGDDEE